MEAIRSHKNRYLALVALALLFTTAFVTVIAVPEADAAGNVTLYVNGGYLKIDGDRSTQNYYSEYVSGYYPTPTFTLDSTFEDSDGTKYEFCRDGYTLLGWSTNRRAETPEVNVGSSISVDGGKTYYAIWKENVVTLYPNGGNITGGNKPPSSLEITIEDYSTVPGSKVTTNKQYTFSKTGYVLAGWATNASSNSPELEEGDVLPLDHSYSLYAIWKKQIQITYNENGGLAEPNTCSFQTYKNQVIPSNTFTINGTEYTYSRSGYTFLGWSTSSDATSAEYLPGALLVTGENPITLYAVWAEGCQITFDPNGGTANHIYCPVVNAPLYVPGKEFNVEGDEYIYQNSGYSFLGWSRDSNSSVPEYVEGNILPKTTTGYTLYAIWSPEASKITFDYGDGVTAVVYVDYGYTFDSSSYMTYTPADKVGYKIVGWSTVKMSDTKDGGDAYILPPSADTYSRKITFDSITNLTLHPIWAKKVTAPSTGSLSFTYVNTGCYYVDSAAGAKGIVVDRGSPHLFIDGVTVDFSKGGSSGQRSPFVLTNGATVNLTVLSDCYFKGQDNYNTGNYNLGYAGINVQSGTTLIVSNDSLGKLTAIGGDAKSTRSWGTNTYGRAGAGIGANGKASTAAPYDDGCGHIIINGGKISAYGGTGWVDLNPNTVNYNVVAAQGIGGETQSGSYQIEINAGTVVAATGHANGYYYDGDNRVITSNAIVFRNPIYDGTTGESSRTFISPNAFVTQVSNKSSTVTGDYDIVKFTNVKEDDYTQCTIGNALSFTIDGVETIDLGGSTIARGVQIKIPVGKIGENSDVSLVTKVGNYFTGTVVDVDSSGDVTIYSVDLMMMSDSAPHGTVEVYANEVSVTGIEAFGYISPSESFTIGSDNTSDRSMTYPFTISLNTGYEFVGVKTKSSASAEWQVHEISARDGESISQSGSTITCILKLNLSSQGTGTANYVSFTIKKTTVEVTIKNTYSEGDMSFFEKTFKTGTSDPSSLSWASTDYKLGTQYVYYKDSLTCTIDVTRGDNENPFIVKWITVNDVPLTPVYDQEHNKGQYTFTITDISEDTVIEVRYGPTVKLSGYITYPAGTAVESKYRIYVQGINADGTDGFLIEKSGTVIDKTDQSKTYVSCDVYVGKGSAAYFKIYSSGTKTVDGKTVEDWDSKNGLELGISKITVSATGIRDRSVYPNVENVYSLGTLYADTEINVLLTEITGPGRPRNFTR